MKPGVPAALEAICLRAMALDPRDRYRRRPRWRTTWNTGWRTKPLRRTRNRGRAAGAVDAASQGSGGGPGGDAGSGTDGRDCRVAGAGAKEREANEQGLRSIAEDKRLEADKQKGEAEKQKGLADDQRAEAMKLRTIAESQQSGTTLFVLFTNQAGRPGLAGGTRSENDEL